MALRPCLRTRAPPQPRLGCTVQAFTRGIRLGPWRRRLPWGPLPSPAHGAAGQTHLIFARRCSTRGQSHGPCRHRHLLRRLRVRPATGRFLLGQPSAEARRATTEPLSIPWQRASQELSSIQRRRPAARLRHGHAGQGLPLPSAARSALGGTPRPDLGTSQRPPSLPGQTAGLSGRSVPELPSSLVAPSTPAWLDPIDRPSLGGYLLSGW